ncbi:MAG TPA: DUF4249 family protein [Chitinophagales bacterium]|nr:DUF4249 family protein [Chitinophagales bacterium]
MAVVHHIQKLLKPVKQHGWMLFALLVTACSKEVNIDIPAQAKQVVVEGSIENNVPPIVLLTQSQEFFGNLNLNNLSAYFVHGAQVKVTGSDGSEVQLQEFCLQDLNLPQDETDQLLSALGYTSIDSQSVVNVCAYTVPDIVTYYLTGTCSYTGKEHTTYNLDIVCPSLSGSADSTHITASTYIPTALGMDSLVVRPDPDPKTADSMAAVYAYVTVPDTFGNFLRYKTKRNNEPFYNPAGGSVYDDKLFVGRNLGLPIERGQSPDADFNLSTDTYFWKGDTVTVKWSNIDSKTYQFYFTLENDGGGSPFSSPVKIQGNVTNAYGIWAGYGTKYYTVIIPQ